MSYDLQPRTISLSDAMAQQKLNRGIDPIAIEPELLLKRIKAGGHSGQFLADAFMSAYRMTPFPHGLGELFRLDAEAFRLFHGVLHMRHVKGWSDDALYRLEQKIKNNTSDSFNMIEK